ncbi:hypothetical protein MYX76_17105 [Desulfobacterota bacterium AH_259_B03_O07]|nr:hypothetical protein [Desulfobacterota bacterium AH_259_B03_O07]
MWLMDSNSYKRIEEMQRQNMDKLNYEISKYFLTKGKKDRQATVSQERREKLKEIESQIRFEKAHTVPVGKPLRSQLQLIRDKLLTTKQLIPDEGQDKRVKALCEVLCAINEREYEVLKKLFADGKIIIEIPDKRLAGRVSRVKKFTDAIFYLSPDLESRPYSYVREVTAHEVAHVLLHSDFSVNKRISLQEAEAKLKTKEWEF